MEDLVKKSRTEKGREYLSGFKMIDMTLGRVVVKAKNKLTFGDGT